MSLLVVDISNNNGSVDFARLARVPGLVGVYLKATEGRTFTDSTYAHRAQEARRRGLRVGAYHFARFGDCEREAEHFLNVAGRPDRLGLRPVLDAEAGNGNGRASWCAEWVDRVWKLGGTLPILYSYPAWLDGADFPKPIGEGLWLASYDRNDGAEHPYHVPAPWRRAVLHQFTSRARVPGVAGLADLSSGRSLRPLLAHPLVGAL